MVDSWIFRASYGHSVSMSTLWNRPDFKQDSWVINDSNYTFIKALLTLWITYTVSRELLLIVSAYIIVLMYKWRGKVSWSGDSQLMDYPLIGSRIVTQSVGRFSFLHFLSWFTDKNSQYNLIWFFISNQPVFTLTVLPAWSEISCRPVHLIKSHCNSLCNIFLDF